MVWIGLPAPSCSLCLCPGWPQHTSGAKDRDRDGGSDILIQGTNLLERLHGEIKRRINVVGNFPKRRA